MSTKPKPKTLGDLKSLADNISKVSEIYKMEKHEVIELMKVMEMRRTADAIEDIQESLHFIKENS